MPGTRRNLLTEGNLYMNKRPDFDYTCECGYLYCDECEYPYYPMEAQDGDTCPECGFGTVREKEYNKRQLIHDISAYAFEHTESWEEPDGPPEARRTFGVELAYLVYAIIKDEPYEAASESRLLELLRECMPQSHPVWKQIRIPEVE